tara:strand:+ start:3127 stop:4800 length:1674 start_codon:yes stop_codon:yes gene_type:complete
VKSTELKHRLLILLSTVSCLAPLSCPAAEGWEIFVQNGKEQNTSTVGSHSRQQDRLVIKGIGTVVHGGEFLYGGDFTMRARLSLPELNGSGASLIVGGHYHHADARTDHGAVRLWLDAADGLLRVTAPRNSQFLLRAEDQVIGKRSDLLKPNRLFDLELRCRGTNFTVRLDGRQIYRAAAYQGMRKDWIGKLGFMPHRGEIQLIDFRAQGNFARVALPHVNLWDLDEDGYFNVRHPVIHNTDNGTLLVIAGGRRHDDTHEEPDQDLIMKRSTDGGRTWSKTKVLWDPWNPGEEGPPIEAQMCTAVVDREMDAVFAVTTRQWFDKESGKWRGGPWIMQSTDDGLTWTNPKPIGGDIVTHWQILKTCASGIQLRSGRLLLPGYGVLTDGQEAGCLLISDDHGKTWRQGGFTGHGLRIPEPTPVELSDGRVMVNMRFKPRTTRSRTFVVSNDGGETFGPLQTDTALPDPGCQGALWRHNATQILFSNPAFTGGRFRMTVKLSEDDGKSWLHSRLIYGGFSSYSHMTTLPDNRIGLIFESDSFMRIKFVPIDLAWLKSANP